MQKQGEMLAKKWGAPETFGSVCAPRAYSAIKAPNAIRFPYA